MVTLLHVPEYATVELSSEDQGAAFAKFCSIHRAQWNAAVE